MALAAWRTPRNYQSVARIGVRKSILLEMAGPFSLYYLSGIEMLWSCIEYKESYTAPWIVLKCLVACLVHLAASYSPLPCHVLGKPGRGTLAHTFWITIFPDNFNLQVGKSQLNAFHLKMSLHEKGDLPAENMHFIISFISHLLLACWWCT